MKIILTQRGSHPIDEDTAEELLDDFDINGDGRFDIEGLYSIIIRSVKTYNGGESLCRSTTSDLECFDVSSLKASLGDTCLRLSSSRLHT